MRHIICILLCLVLCAATCTAVSAQESETITAIVFPNSSAVAEENLSVSGYGDKDSGYASSTVGGRLYASVSGTDYRKLEWSKGEYQDLGMQPVMTGGTKNPWGNGAFLEIRVPTAGYESITFSASIGATKKGPRDYKLQISTDGVNYSDVAGQVFSIPANKILYPAFDNAALPADAANVDMLYIRIAVASNMMVNGTAGLIGGTGGETAINNILVSGIPMAVSTTAYSTTTRASEATTTTTEAAFPEQTTASAVTADTTTSALSAPTAQEQASTTTTMLSGVNTGDDRSGTQISALVLLLTLSGFIAVGATKSAKNVGSRTQNN